MTLKIMTYRKYLAFRWGLELDQLANYVRTTKSALERVVAEFSQQLHERVAAAKEVYYLEPGHKPDSRRFIQRFQFSQAFQFCDQILLPVAPFGLFLVNGARRKVVGSSDWRFIREFAENLPEFLLQLFECPATRWRILRWRLIGLERRIQIAAFFLVPCLVHISSLEESNRPTGLQPVLPFLGSVQRATGKTRHRSTRVARCFSPSFSP